MKRPENCLTNENSLLFSCQDSFGLETTTPALRRNAYARLEGGGEEEVGTEVDFVFAIWRLGLDSDTFSTDLFFAWFW